jgi:uncharacterized membrane protein HdeD (DUF308 family)
VTDIGASIPPPPRPIEYRDVDARGWWATILVGFALVALGLWLLTNLYESVTVLALLVGVSLLAGGLLEVATANKAGTGWAGWVAGGLLAIAGIVVLAWPDITLWALAVAAGLGLMAGGAVHAFGALRSPRGSDRTVQIVVGVLGVVLGAAVVAWPGATLVVLAVLLGIRALVTGIVAIATGWQLHRLAS